MSGETVLLFCLGAQRLQERLELLATIATALEMVRDQGDRELHMLLG